MVGGKLEMENGKYQIEKKNLFLFLMKCLKSVMVLFIFHNKLFRCYYCILQYKWAKIST